MTTQLVQAVQQAIDAFDAFGEDDDFASLFALSQKMEALRAAIQQAEAKTDAPVGYMNAGNIHELKQGELPYGYVYSQKESGVSVPVYTHPATGVPDGWKLVRYPITEGMHAAACKVLIRSHGLSGVPQRMLTAMLATAQAQKSTDPQDTYVNGLAQANNEQD